jgi:hypothetical protein
LLVDNCGDGHIKFKCEGEVAFAGMMWINDITPASDAVVRRVEEIMRQKIVFQSHPEQEL